MLSSAIHRVRIPPASAWRWLVAAVALLVGLALEWTDSSVVPGRGIDRLLQDQITKWRASDTPETRVVIVDIDEDSLSQVGPWPWPRSVLIDLVEKLVGDYAAKSVALDLVLPQTGPVAGADRLLPLAEHGPVVFSQVFDYVPRAPALRVGTVASGQRVNENTSAAAVVAATGYIGNYAQLASSARCVGNIGLIPDDGGSARHLPLVTRFEGFDYGSLPFVMLRCAGMIVKQPSSKPRGLWRIPYLRNWSAFAVIPAGDVLADRAPRQLIEHKLVLIGSSSFGLGDRVATPLDNSTAGVMVHAAAISALLDGQGDPTPAARVVATAWLALVVLISTVLLPRLQALHSAALLFGSGAAWIVLCFVWVPVHAEYSPVGPLATVLVLLVVAVPYEWRIAQLESRRLMRTFRHYVAQPVIDELLLQDQGNPLKPRLLKVTTLVADMEGYAGLIEKASLDEAVELTRGFLDTITGPILESHGTLDKYTGDGLMAFWGAPLPVADHADKAVDAAVAMVHAVEAFNLKRRAVGLAAVRVRIGVDSGLAVAGDLGTPFRGAYTAVGDSVNIASRLQEVARDLPHDIVLGAGVARMVTRHALVPLGEIHIRGRFKPLQIFTVRAHR